MSTRKIIVMRGTRIHRVKRRHAGPSALEKLKEKTGCTNEMIEKARKEQNTDIPLSQMGIVDSAMKQLNSAKPKPAKLMKCDRKKG